MDNEGSSSAAAGSLLELVGPAAIIGHPVATKAASHRVILCNAEIRIVDEEEGDFVGEVNVAIIVPVAFWRARAKADKDDGCVSDFNRLARIG